MLVQTEKMNQAFQLNINIQSESYKVSLTM